VFFIYKCFWEFEVYPRGIKKKLIFNLRTVEWYEISEALDWSLDMTLLENIVGLTVLFKDGRSIRILRMCSNYGKLRNHLEAHRIHYSV